MSGVLLEVLMLYGRRQDVVVASRDEQQRRTIIVGKVIRGCCMRGEVCESALEQNASWDRNGVSIVNVLRFLAAQIVREGVVKFFLSNRHCAMQIGGIV